MSEIHETKDIRNIAIDFIGVRKMKLPFTFVSNAEYSTIASIDAGVYLSQDKKGARLSWIVEALNNDFADQKLTIKDCLALAEKVASNLETKDVILNISFQIIIPIETPVSQKKSFKEVDIIIDTTTKESKQSTSVTIGVYGAMCCPNSKAKSKYGAHSQRCYLTTKMQGNIEEVSIEEAAILLDKAFSAPVFSVVKSVDEVYMTELAYENPKFTEDLIRDAIILLKEEYPSLSFIVEAENFESIHSHNVLARGIYNNG